MKVENPYGESDMVMYPLAKFSSRNLSSATCSLADIGYILQLNVAGASLFSSILWSQDLDGGNFFASSSENKASWRLNSSGSLISSLPCSCAYLCAISVALWVRLIWSISTLLVAFARLPSICFLYRATCSLSRASTGVLLVHLRSFPHFLNKAIRSLSRASTDSVVLCLISTRPPFTGVSPDCGMCRLREKARLVGVPASSCSSAEGTLIPTFPEGQGAKSGSGSRSGPTGEGS